MKTLSTTKVRLLWTLILLPAINIAQSFEGTITYVNDIQVPQNFIEMGMTNDMMKAELRKKGAWFDTLRISYMQGNYYSLANNNLKKIYKADVNKIYNFNSTQKDVCGVQDALDLDLSGEPDKPTVIELDSTAVIMGLPCKIIRMKWPLSQIDYYYNVSQAKANPSLFSKHTSEGLSDFVSKTKCLPLQIVRTLMGMDIVQTAVQVKPETIKPSLFTVPELVEDESLNVMKVPGLKLMRIKK